MSHKVIKTKFTSSYYHMYTYNITILATSHKVTKTIFDKTKTIDQRLGQLVIGLTKKSLMTYQRLIFTDSQVTKKILPNTTLTNKIFTITYSHSTVSWSHFISL